MSAPAPEMVVLLDPETDRATGTMEKLEAHRAGRYHAAISVLIFDGEGRQLVQRRAAGKYHAAGLWSNACCSHPRPGEAPAAAAVRRLREELGIAAQLAAIGTVRYRARVPAGAADPIVGGEAPPTPPAAARPGLAAAPGPATFLTEHERVDLFVGRYAGAVDPDPDEVEAAGWWSAAEIERAVASGQTTPWFRLYAELFGSGDGAALEAMSKAGSIADRGFFDLT
ncbi:isopentenyl-diphosphate Delta-isomerase [Faunimonas sp. B44]|uniref:isopentenyl-diphosphate Delta-isomerase n=1 Tax=Faunimonas sp. B44 TaxID=3461493 RepID=UPI004044635C